MDLLCMEPLVIQKRMYSQLNVLVEKRLLISSLCLQQRALKAEANVSKLKDEIKFLKVSEIN